MLDRARLAMHRLLTMANLFENFCEAYGDDGVLSAGGPLGYGLFPSPALGYRDCLRFTNLAAEALIRELDLKKGERVILCLGDPVEAFLVAMAVIKAGGIAVPVEAGISSDELRRRVEGCGAALFLADGSLLAACPDLAEVMAKRGRLMACGPRGRVPGGIASLDEAMERSSGFFLPYTLKPGNVVGLFHHETPPGRLRAVMATNEMLLGPRRVAALLPPFRPGAPFLAALSPCTLAGFSVAVTALASGMRLSFVPGDNPRAALAALERIWPAVFAAEPGLYSSMLEEAGSGGIPFARLWLCCGYGLSREEVLELGRNALEGKGRRRFPTPVLETWDAGGNAVMLALKISFGPRVWPRADMGLVIPPNRARLLDRGRESGRVLAIKGPAVTPGYWNDLEGTLAARRGGWLLAGVDSPASPSP